MSLRSLEILQFRNLHQVHIEPDAGLNIITGDNAAGKTSLLESIYYLSYGRSFRSSQTRDLIQHEKEHFRLVCKTNSEGHESVIGIQKSTREQIIRVNQQNVSSISELSTLLPVVALHPDSHRIISSGPEYRRQFMDWGVFHVEQEFLRAWKNYRKALSQRNAALRNHQSDKICSLWNLALVENGEAIQKARQSYLDDLGDSVKKISQIIFPNNEITMSYRKGWAEDQNYHEYLQQTLARDKEKGFTQAGPHRADIKIKLDAKSAQTSISRGQQKKLVTLMVLAQLDMFLHHSNKTCILLYDDLPAELDPENRKLIMDMLGGMNVQLFVSSIEHTQLDYSAWKDGKMFHVEHGEVTTQSLY